MDLETIKKNFGRWAISGRKSALIERMRWPEQINRCTHQSGGRGSWWVSIKSPRWDSTPEITEFSGIFQSASSSAQFPHFTAKLLIGPLLAKVEADWVALLIKSRSHRNKIPKNVSDFPSIFKEIDNWRNVVRWKLWATEPSISMKI